MSPHWKLQISYFRTEFRQIHKCHGFYSFCAPVCMLPRFLYIVLEHVYEGKWLFVSETQHKVFDIE